MKFYANYEEAFIFLSKAFCESSSNFSDPLYPQPKYIDDIIYSVLMYKALKILKKTKMTSYLKSN